MKHVFLIFTVFFVSMQVLNAQELRCNISVNASKITGANREIFRSMQMDLYEFMNNRAWTNHTFKNNEKIECSINIQINRQVSSDEYEAFLTVQSKRPVYNSSYRTTILNIRDEYFRFNYQEFQPIEFSETGNKDNLTSVLAYYAYMIIGYDYDTFSPEGGTEYFERARTIVNESQNAPAVGGSNSGWRAFESDYNRYWLVDNVLNKSYSPFRQLMYEYHRKGLDKMAESVDEGRANIAESLRLIQKVFRTRTRLYITQQFFNTKSSELINIFSKSYPDEQERVVKILSECDPSNASKYEKITSGENSVIDEDVF
jgi:hypothetical protein